MKLLAQSHVRKAKLNELRLKDNSLIDIEPVRLRMKAMQSKYNIEQKDKAKNKNGKNNMDHLALDQTVYAHEEMDEMS